MPTDLERMKAFYKILADMEGYKLNPDDKIVERVLRGLLTKEAKFGKRYCPCRAVTEDETINRGNICPCVFHREEIATQGHCLCKLFVSDPSVLNVEEAIREC